MLPQAFDPQPLSMTNWSPTWPTSSGTPFPASLKLATDLAPDLWKARPDARNAPDRVDDSAAYGMDVSLAAMRRFAHENGGEASVDIRNGHVISWC